MADTTITIEPATDALLDVDVQIAFMRGGGLPVTDGEAILPIVKRVGALFPLDRRFASVDRHPAGHISLASSYRFFTPFTALNLQAVTDRVLLGNRDIIAPRARFTMKELISYLSRIGTQVLWPDHALEGTAQSELHPELSKRDYAHVICKGGDAKCDSYSALRDNLRRPTGLSDILRAAGVKRLFLTGLAFDYCVGFSALDAQEDGFEAHVLEDATRSVAPDSALAMRKRLLAANVRLISSDVLR